MLIQIPKELMFDKRLGAAEKLYWACLAAGVAPDFGESASTVKRRMKALKECGLFPVKKVPSAVNPEAAGAGTDEEVLALLDAMMEPPRKVGKRGRAWIQALIDVHGLDKVLDACRYVVFLNVYPFCQMRELIYQISQVASDRGDLLCFSGSELSEVERERLFEGFRLLNVSAGIQKYARARLLLLGQQYGVTTVIDACKRLIPYNPTLRDDVVNLPCERVELIRRVLAGEPLEEAVQ